jgi:hypothetical protein
MWCFYVFFVSKIAMCVVEPSQWQAERRPRSGLEEAGLIEDTLRNESANAIEKHLEQQRSPRGVGLKLNLGRIATLNLI